MTIRLENKVALVTGAGSSGPGIGVGRAIAVRFARAGAKVLLVDVNAGAAEETLEMIRKDGGEGHVHLADLRNSRNCSAAVEESVARYGGLDCIVNNLAITRPSQSLAETDEADWDDIIAVNLTAAMMMAKYGAPRLANGGAILNIGSGAAQRGSPGHNPAYTASKGALASLTRLWAVELGRRQIRVNCIEPGPIDTPVANASLNLPERRRRLRAHMVPLDIEGTAWDVAAAAVFLASDEARWISGAVLPVDGGFTAATPFFGAEAAATFEG